jgi:multidrug efflux pump subunit AcrA (membrane-fusion protein)
MQTILHIGLEKTGTTSLQHLLVQNKVALANQGVLVSKALHAGNNFYLALASFSSYRPDSLLVGQGVRSQAGLDAFRARIRAALKAEVQAAKGAKKVVLTSEHLQSRLTSIADLETLKANLEFAGLTQPTILVYLREPIRIALSHHGMAIKKGVHVDSSFFEPNHPRVSHILGFKNSLQMWQQVFGAQNVQVRLYPEGQKPDALVTDFFAACQIDTANLNLDSTEKRNVNLSLGALQILNGLNGRNKLVANQVASKAFFDRLEKHVPGKGLLADAATIAKFDEFYADSNEWVRAQFFADQTSLFESKLQSSESLEKQPSTDEILGVLQAALEVLDERDAQLAKLKSSFMLAPKALKKVLKRFF